MEQSDGSSYNMFILSENFFIWEFRQNGSRRIVNLIHVSWSMSDMCVLSRDARSTDMRESDKRNLWVKHRLCEFFDTWKSSCEWMIILTFAVYPSHFELEITRDCPSLRDISVSSFAPFFRRLAANWVSALIEILSEYRVAENTFINSIYHHLVTKMSFIFIPQRLFDYFVDIHRKKYIYMKYLSKKNNILQTFLLHFIVITKTLHLDSVI